MNQKPTVTHTHFPDRHHSKHTQWHCSSAGHFSPTNIAWDQAIAALTLQTALAWERGARTEELFKSNWRKHHMDVVKKHFSRLEKAIQGLQKKAADEGIPMEEVVDVLELTWQKDWNESMSKMVDWMLHQGLIPQGKKGRPPSNFNS
jgi:hypothetical protein